VSNDKVTIRDLHSREDDFLSSDEDAVAEDADDSSLEGNEFAVPHHNFATTGAKYSKYKKTRRNE